ncbi:tetratricopeptide repeat protein [uncultured Dokdonia sp.]|uniref:tetratricopeptide repeat protein n=1 Tax=uncultured Dokdonia sp. TaxID=575653 RepID=UPI0026244E57|nr:tetratricopeptide repeat protein [uncultured Dokdonia sp.]
MFYYVIIGLQLYCAYHAYTTRNKLYWYLIIFLAPLLGSIVYLVTQVFTKRDAAIVQKEITAVINPTKKVKDLEAKVAFADTFQNRLDLADAYTELNDYENAITNYKKALSGSHSQDYYTTAQLLKAYYHTQAYDQVITCAQIIKDKSDFETSKAQFLYGLSLSKMNRDEEAEVILKKIDQRYSNYEERLILARFYKDNNKLAAARELLEELGNEGNYMTKPNKRLHRDTFIEIHKLYNEITA